MATKKKPTAGKKPAPKLTIRECDVLEALTALRKNDKKATGFAPSAIATMAHINSSSQACVLLKALVLKKLVNKVGDALYRKA